ncbi:hypothetical protein FG379_002742 [Cryptosporidium bovis]|uniref:uncharacterized protein n=1 Tax=Cryptosporidium bovis TaxID=310047 RepID=UPI00351A7FC7|nr:hypothetical protein FG379_002742 [Cryptosporidium bovis]
MEHGENIGIGIRGVGVGGGIGRGVEKEIVHCIKQLPSIPSCLSVCHWSRSVSLMNERFERELLSHVTEYGDDLVTSDPMLNRVAVGGRALLQLITVEYNRISSFYNISRTNFVKLAWSRSAHTLGGMALNGSVNIFVGLKGRHWQMSYKFRPHNVAGCCIEWLGDSQSIIALGFQDGQVQIVDGGTIREYPSNLGSSEEKCSTLWSGCIVSSPVRDLQTRHLNVDTWINNELLLAYDDGTISLLDFRQKASQCTKIQTQYKGLSCLRWNPHDINLFASGCRNGLQVWDIRMMDGLTPVTKIKSQFVVGKVRWRPGFPTQIAYCCSAIDSNIHIYDLLDPVRPYLKFSKHNDVIRDFDWIETDAIITCGSDKKLVLSTWEESPKHNSSISMSSCTYVPFNKQEDTKDFQCTQRLVFHLSHDFYREDENKYINKTTTASGGNANSSNSIVDDGVDIQINHNHNLNMLYKKAICDNLLKYNSIFRLCSEKNDIFKYPLYSITGFLPDINLTQFVENLSFIINPKCRIDRVIHRHDIYSSLISCSSLTCSYYCSPNDWLAYLTKLKSSGITPCWNYIISNISSSKISDWYLKWGSRFRIINNINVNGKCDNLDNGNKYDNIFLVSPGRGESPNCFMFSRESLKSFSIKDKIECIFEFYIQVLQIRILSDNLLSRLKKSDNIKLGELLKCIQEELNYLTGRNNIVSSLILLTNVIMLLVPVNTRLHHYYNNLVLKWTFNLIKLLRKFGIYSLSSHVIKTCPYKEIRDLGRENISESNFYCGVNHFKNNNHEFSYQLCKKVILAKKYIPGESKPCENNNNRCKECKTVRNVCCVCNEVVFGRWTSCPCCGHGGHPRHISEWYKHNSYCPSGCGHKCI